MQALPLPTPAPHKEARLTREPLLCSPSSCKCAKRALEADASPGASTPDGRLLPQASPALAFASAARLKSTLATRAPASKRPTSARAPLSVMSHQSIMQHRAGSTCAHSGAASIEHRGCFKRKGRTCQPGLRASHLFDELTSPAAARYTSITRHPRGKLPQHLCVRVRNVQYFNRSLGDSTSHRLPHRFHTRVRFFSSPHPALPRPCALTRRCATLCRLTSQPLPLLIPG
jgi:hypothetical protein